MINWAEKFKEADGQITLSLKDYEHFKEDFNTLYNFRENLNKCVFISIDDANQVNFNVDCEKIEFVIYEVVQSIDGHCPVKNKCKFNFNRTTHI